MLRFSYIMGDVLDFHLEMRSASLMLGSLFLANGKSKACAGLEYPSL